jgi:NTP pyrophosphatase (non-canonical NTP hydrolase)
MNVERLQDRLRQFAEERDWVQFHTPKNLAMALSVEASELLEIFQWLTPEESQEVMASPRAEEVKDEVADILIYLLRLTDVLGVDLDAVVAEKIANNASRFPAVDL